MNSGWKTLLLTKDLVSEFALVLPHIRPLTFYPRPPSPLPYSLLKAAASVDLFHRAARRVKSFEDQQTERQVTS